MAQNPKYDNDVVNLGYLNKRLGQTEESINKNNNSISQLPKNYSIPPNPPYYKDSLLCYKNKIYKCNTTKLNGVFSWNDWTIAATDDTTLSNFINNTYELEKLEIQEQIDGKVQTYYQEMDPSNEWTTDLEKSKHIGDYWYNTTNNTQWRYNRNTTTTPITYGWGQVNVPNSVFDLIDKKKSIYTIKPTSYKKDDLWIIEDTLSDEDLPTGTEDNPIAKGDWVFSVANSDTYNKEHWIKRDEDISLSYLEQHYYTIGDIDSSFKELERNTDSKITKAKEEISLNVSQTYTTKEEHTKAINDFDKQIGTINDTITTHETNISNLNVGVGKISASVESIESKTEKLSVDIDGVKENIIPTATVSGPNIHIEDASDKKMVNFEIEGKSEQATRSGKNLCPSLNITKTINGLTFTKNNDGSITINGTATANTSYPISATVLSKTIQLTANQPYVVSKKNTNNNALLQVNYTQDNTDKYITITNVARAFTPTEDTQALVYIRILSGETINNETIYPQLEEGTVETDYEPYGVMPSPDFPSEIESVGYENLWDEQWELGLYSISDGSKADSTTNIRSKNYIPCFPNKNYYLKANVGNRVCFYDINKNFISIEFDKQNTVFKTPSNCYYMTFNLGSAYGTTYKNDVAIFKGNKERNYIPYGKYEIEVKNTGKNLLNLPDGTYTHNGITAVISNGIITINGTSTATSFLTIPINLELESNFSISLNNTAMGDSLSEVRLQISGSNFRSVSLSVANNKRENISIYGTYTSLLIRISSGVTITNGIIKPQVELGDITTDYEPYQQNTLLFQLDQPLRSLPNGVKDIAYIKNNMLYVDRYVGSMVLNGSESWGAATALHDGYMRFSYNAPAIKGQNRAMSNYFKIGNTSSTSVENLLEYRDTNVIFINTNVATNLNGFKTWLSTHNTQVDYELAEPYTEKIGEVEIPSTFKGVNNITTTDELEPVMNIEYVRDTILSDYVEGQVGNAVAIQERKNAEFQITNEEIKSSVSNISTDLDGTKSSLNSVEEKITSQEKTINIISKNIDGNTGDIREVTTTTGFTFNAEGLTIDDGAGYKAQHTAQGTFYKDGDSITGQYTKDGSKQKDLELFGTYSYGKNDINDTPMFVAQLYTDENGEECFGHFYNGGDY